MLGPATVTPVQQTSATARAGKRRAQARKMAAIHAASFPMHADPHGGKWSKVNKAPPRPGDGDRVATRKRA